MRSDNDDEDQVLAGDLPGRPGISGENETPSDLVEMADEGEPQPLRNQLFRELDEIERQVDTIVSILHRSATLTHTSHAKVLASVTSVAGCAERMRSAVGTGRTLSDLGEKPS